MTKKPFLARLCCLLAAALLMLSFTAGAVLMQLTNAPRFHRALQSHVAWERLGIPPDDLRSFAEETIFYLRGDVPAWEPEVLTAEGPLPLSPAFTAHMETVKNGVATAFRVACWLCAAGILLLIVGLKTGFSTKAWLCGMALPFLLIALICIAAAIDFDGFWYWLHEHFIPDGIFSGYEPIMRLFPASLFSSYIVPLLLTLAAAVVILLLVPVIHKIMIRKRSQP